MIHFFKTGGQGATPTAPSEEYWATVAVPTPGPKDISLQRCFFGVALGTVSY
jgi:hypothetical protein